MARLDRKHQKVFAGQASDNGVFGSLMAEDPTISNDIEELQSLEAWEKGWNQATMTSADLPPLEEIQGLEYVLSRQQAYIFQEGLAEWNEDTTYYKGSIVKVINGSNFIIYGSLADDNTAAVTNTSSWKVLYDSTKTYVDTTLGDSRYVTVATAQTVSGAKTFTQNVNITKTAGGQGSGVYINDTVNGSKTALEQFRTRDGSYYSRLRNIGKPDTNGYIDIIYNPDTEKHTFSMSGIDNAYAVTPASDSNSTDIATTAWTNSKLSGKMNVKPSGIELTPVTGTTNGGYIDFHYAESTEDYTSRIIESPSGNINYFGDSAFSENTSTSSRTLATKGWVNTGLNKKQNTLTFDTTPTSGSTNPVTSGGVYTSLSGKQDTLTFDTTPTSGSTNPVTSGGVYTSLSSKATNSDVVHLAGEETITGQKTIANDVALGLGSTATISGNSGGDIFIKGRNINADLALADAFKINGVSTSEYRDIQFYSSDNGHRVASIRAMLSSDGNVCTAVYGVNNVDNAAPNGIVLRRTSSGIWATAPSSDITDSIVTTTGINKSTNGYVKFGNGIILQWGTIAAGATSGTVSFPTAFSNTNFSVAAANYYNSGSGTLGTYDYTTTGFTYYRSRSDFSIKYIAIGY